MKPKYITQVGAQVTVVQLDSNMEGASNVNIRPAAGVTVLAALENPDDFVAPSSYDLPPASQAIAAGLAGPQWLAVPAAVNGVINLVGPYRALQLTSTAGGVSTVLQKGLQ